MRVLQPLPYMDCDECPYPYGIGQVAVYYDADDSDEPTKAACERCGAIQVVEIRLGRKLPPTETAEYAKVGECGSSSLRS